MGTNYNKNKPKNRVTISRGSDGPAKQVNPENGVQDRSFAQPNPATPPPTIEPKAHASVQEETEALTEHSTQGKNYEELDDN